MYLSSNLCGLINILWPSQCATSLIPHVWHTLELTHIATLPVPNDSPWREILSCRSRASLASVSGIKNTCSTRHSSLRLSISLSDLKSIMHLPYGHQTRTLANYASAISQLYKKADIEDVDQAELILCLPQIPPRPSNHHVHLQNDYLDLYALRLWDISNFCAYYSHIRCTILALDHSHGHTFGFHTHCKKSDGRILSAKSSYQPKDHNDAKPTRKKSLDRSDGCT